MNERRSKRGKSESETNTSSITARDEKDVITKEQMAIICKMAHESEMDVADFARAILRQASDIEFRQIRVSDKEYEQIAKMATDAGMTIARWCSLAVTVFLKQADRGKLFYLFPTEKGQRKKRILMNIVNKHWDAELEELAKMYNSKPATIIRYCALHFDGKVIHMES